MKLHQNIQIDGKDLPSEYPSRRHSKFFNEGKWETFIKPLLPADPTGCTFVEIGCNVGLFLKMATEYGFRRVVGVEADARNCRMAERYRDANGHDYEVLHRTVGKDFDFDELPVADVLLLSNVHYHIHMSAFLPFLDRLRQKTVRCLVVSRQMRTKRHGFPRSNPQDIRLMFQEWTLERVLSTPETMYAKDPHPRRVNSLLFQSGLERQRIALHTTGNHYEKQQEIIDIVRNGREVRLEDTLNWRFWAKRKPKWGEDQVRDQVRHRFDLVRDIMENGHKEPILVEVNGKGIDGGNRAQILKLLGHESIIVRTI